MTALVCCFPFVPAPTCVVVLVSLVRLDVVLLAEERLVARLQVQHLARAELFAAHGAGEAVEVVHLVAGLAHVVVRGDAVAAAGTLRAEAPGTEWKRKEANWLRKKYSCYLIDIVIISSVFKIEI